MKNSKIYRLKVACATLQKLKTNERKYKKALVKRACKLIKTAISRDLLSDASTTYDRIGRDQRAYIDHKLDWSNGFWKSFLGSWIKKYYDQDQDHLDALAVYLTADKFNNDPAQMRDYLTEYGITDKAVQNDLIAKATGLISSGDDVILDEANNIHTNRKNRAFNALNEANKSRAEAIQRLRDLGYDVEDDRRGRRSGYDDRDSGPWGSGRYGHKPSFYRDSYLTDNYISMHPGQAAEVYGGVGGRGPVVNNYYYATPKGKVESAATKALPGLPAEPEIDLPVLKAEPEKKTLTPKEVLTPVEEGADYIGDLIGAIKPEWGEKFKTKTKEVAKNVGEAVSHHPEATKVLTDWAAGNVGTRPGTLFDKMKGYGTGGR